MKTRFTMQLDELDGLTVFAAVAERRSFTAAAAMLGVSASAVSQAIRQLEARLDVTLFHRTTRSVGLTQAGELLFDRAGPALGELRAAVDHARSFDRGIAGQLRINLPRLAFRFAVRPVLVSLMAEHPALRVELIADDGMSDIVASGVDAGIRPGKRVERDMVAVRIQPAFNMITVAAPAYLARAGTPTQPEDLLSHDCIRYRFQTSGRLADWDFQRDGRDFSMAVGGRVTTNDTTIEHQAGLDGLGVVQTIDLLVAEDIAAGRLVRILEPYTVRLDGLFLYFPRASRNQPKLRVFIDACRRRLRSLPDVPAV